MFKMYVWACTNTASNDMYSYSKAFGTPHIRNKTTNQNRNVRSIYEKKSRNTHNPNIALVHKYIITITHKLTEYASENL